MDWFVKYFIKSSLVWFSLAVALAVTMALVPALTVYRTAHLHMALLGFVTQMIYGVALHVIPRFFGQPLVHRRAAEVQFWAAQSGLLLLVTGFATRVHVLPMALAALALGGVLSAIGAGCFVVNLWRTIDASPMSRINATGRRVPLMPQADAH
ncbi:MAG: cbb3-type cytochrome c oxidase subunit I [Gemmatimonadaceae bacterium]|nr:cbb3-type cytochrome c oxidase subunit I [Gemmatimonadaceae bacterium]